MFTSKKDTYKLTMGAISAFENALIVDRQGVRNCDRGWAADHKTCANSCRVAWLQANPRATYKKDPAEFYKKNFGYAKCEACALWSGLVKPKSPGFFQKALSHLKRGAPTFCRRGQTDCDEREREFAACHGTAVCADDCWASGANKFKCMGCYNSYCKSKGFGLEVRSKFYSLCLNFAQCYRRFPAHKYARANLKYKLMGQGCWGKPFNSKLEVSSNPMDRMKQETICAKTANTIAMPYPDWMALYTNCTAAICSNSNVDFFNQQKCDSLRCTKTCLNGAQMSKECLQCRYGVDSGSQCTTNACKKFSFPVDCYNSCRQYEDLRLKGITADDPEYARLKDECKSEQCYRYQTSMCKACLKRCEDKGKRIYNSMIGTNLWKQNFDGWGCAYHCTAKNIGALSEFRGVEMHGSPEIEKFTNAFDAISLGAMDWNHMSALKEWAKGGWKATEQH